MAKKENEILQAGSVPYRVRKERLEICLITTRKGRWGFPKGIIDPGETPEETALKEAQEEAGLGGKVNGKPIGSYRYRKWGVELVCTMFLLKVTSIEDRWEESWRQREWFSLEAARQVLDREELLSLVDAAETRLSRQIAEKA